MKHANGLHGAHDVDAQSVTAGSGRAIAERSWSSAAPAVQVPETEELPLQYEPGPFRFFPGGRATGFLRSSCGTSLWAEDSIESAAIHITQNAEPRSSPGRGSRSGGVDGSESR